MEQCFTHVERRQSKINISSKFRSPIAIGYLWQPTQGNCPTHIPLLPRIKGRVPYPQRKDIAVGLIRYHMAHMLKQNKGVHRESKTGKDIPTWGDEPSTGNEDSLPLGKASVPSLRLLLLCGQEGVERLYEQYCLSQQCIWNLADVELEGIVW